MFWLQVYQPKCSFQDGINLTLLADNTKLWNGLVLYSGNSVFYENPNEMLTKNINDLKSSKGLKTKNYCMAGTKNEIIKYIKTHDIAGVTVDNVKLSSYERQ